MTLKTWMSSAAVLALLVGCTPEEAPPETPTNTTEPASESATLGADVDAYMSFANDPFTVAGASEADLSALVDSLPDYANVTWGTKSFEAETGATVFEDFAIEFGETEKFGLNIETAKIWGYDDSLIVARLQGQRLDQTGPLFTRMEGTNASYVGVAPALNAIFSETLEQLDAELPEGFDFGFDRLESNTERFVVSGVSLRPWELSPLPPEMITSLDEDIPAEVVEFVHAGQWLAALTRSMAIEKSVSLGTDVAIEMRQPGANLEGTFSVDLSAADNIQGFDIETNLTHGYSSSQTTTYTDAMTPGEVITLSGFPAGFTMAQGETYGSAEIKNMRLDKLMGFFARSELPGMDERDLLSLGTWELSDYVSQLDDNTILTAERAYFNGDSFEWILPSDLSFGMSGATLNTGELTDFFFVFFESGLLSSVPEGDEEVAAQMELVSEGIQKAIELLPEYGLDQIPFDASISASWAADAGPTDFAMRFDADGFGRGEVDLGISLPVYEALNSAFDAEDREDAFETAFVEAFAFRGARWFEEDKGGYDKLFGFAHALGKEYPDQGWGAMLGNMEPAQLRTYLGTMTRMVKTPASEEFPPAADWIEAYASYLETGGSIEFVSAPPQPINEALIDSYEDEPEPEEIVEIFGLTVTHTK